MTIQPLPLEDLSSCELRLELAEAEQSRSKTWKGRAAKKDRIAAITVELVERGTF
jgi:hypothetical protein